MCRGQQVDRWLDGRMGDQQRSELKASGLGMNRVGVGRAWGCPSPKHGPSEESRGVTCRALAGPCVALGYLPNPDLRSRLECKLMPLPSQGKASRWKRFSSLGQDHLGVAPSSLDEFQGAPGTDRAHLPTLEKKARSARMSPGPQPHPWEPKHSPTPGGPPKPQRLSQSFPGASAPTWAGLLGLL